MMFHIPRYAQVNLKNCPYLLPILSNIVWGVQPHFCPSPNPDFDVSWEKMGKNVQKWGKKYMERERKSIRFRKLLMLYYHYFRHINY